MAKDKNILLVWERLGHYHFERAEKLRGLSTGQVITADLGGSDKLYKWSSDGHKNHFTLSSKPVHSKDIYKRVSAYLTLVKKHGIKVAGIAGYAKPELLLFLIINKFLGIKTVMFNESWYPKSSFSDRLKGKLINFLASVVFASGERAKNHLVNNLGVDAQKIITGYSSIDNTHFTTDTTNYSSKVLLCIARFSEEKNLINLIEAFNLSELPAAGWRLRLVGDGPLREDIQGFASPTIQIDNWLNYNELPECYASASAFILVSNFEPWGLVVNEAMAAGLPCICSNEVGAVDDLLVGEATKQDGVSVYLNGMVCNTSKEGITQALNRLAGFTTPQLAEMGQISKSRVDLYSSHNWAVKFLLAAKAKN